MWSTPYACAPCCTCVHVPRAAHQGTCARPDLITIALVPAGGGADAAAAKSLAADLRWALSGFGQTLNPEA